MFSSQGPYSVVLDLIDLLGLKRNTFMSQMSDIMLLLADRVHGSSWMP